MLKKVLSGGAWLAALKLLVNFLTLISTFVLARLLSPEDFGVVAIAVTVQLILVSCTEISMAQALIFHKNITKAHLDTAFTLNAIRGLAVFLVMAAISIPAALFYELPNLTLVFMVLGVSVLFKSLASPVLAVFEKELNFRPLFLIAGSSKIVSFTVSVWVAYTFQSYWAIALGIVFSELAYLLLSYVLAPFLPRICFSETKALFSFSGWVTASNVINTINWNFDNLFIGKILGEKALGLYKVGNTIAIMPSKEITAPLRQLLFPSFSKFQEDYNAMSRAYMRSQTLTAFLILPAGAGLACVAEILVLLAMGEKWLGVVPVVQVLAVLFSFQALSTLANPLAMSLGKTKQLFYRDLSLFLVRVPIVYFCAVNWGLMGIVWGRVVSGSIAIIVALFLVKHFLGLGLLSQLSSNMRTLFASLLMSWFVVCYLQNFSGETFSENVMSLVCAVVFGFVVYVLSVFALWLSFRKPAGAEAECIGIFKLLLAKLSIGK